MAKKGTILFIGSSLIAALYTRSAARLLGYKIIFVLNPDDYSGQPAEAIMANGYYKADVNSVMDVSRVINEHDLIHAANVVAVTTFLDELFPVALEIAQMFNLIAPDPALTQLSSKAFIQQKVPEFTPPTIIISRELSDQELTNFFSRCPETQFMLKPGISSGAVGISVVKKSVSVRKILNKIRDSKVSNATQQPWLLQPRLGGRLYSLEGYVTGGKVITFGFSRRTREGLTEVANEFPVDTDLDPSIRQKCMTAIEQLVQRSNYKYGYFHAEFIINTTSQSAHLIDPNMGRLSGAGTVKQFADFFGLNPVQIIQHVIGLGLFKAQSHPFEYPKAPDPMRRVFLVNYCLPRPATVQGIVLPPDMRTFHVRLADQGRKMPGAGNTDSAWVGFIVGSKNDVQRDLDRIVIKTDDDDVKPHFRIAEGTAIALSHQSTVFANPASHQPAAEAAVTATPSPLQPQSRL